MKLDYKNLLAIALRATIVAGTEIMRQYHEGFETMTKSDGSPVTTADIKAHDILEEALTPTGVAVMSEEGEKFTHTFRQTNAYWCLDPIDGTKDFVNKTDEFCVSVGLISEDTSKLGVLYAPALGLLYFAAEGIGSYKLNGGQTQAEQIIATPDVYKQLLKKSNRLDAFKLPENYTFLTSRFHRDAKTDEYIQALKSEHENLDVVSMGCAIKLGLISEKKAHEYTRYMPVNFWDIAGGHAIAKYAGLPCVNPLTQLPINYQDENMKVTGYALKW